MSACSSSARWTPPDDEFNPTARPPHENIWDPLDTASCRSDPKLHQVLLAYASDMSLMDTAIMPHGASWRNVGGRESYNHHAMWFHHPLRVDDWLLYNHDAPVSPGGRGFNRGLFFTRVDGKLVASTIQEGLMRPRKRRSEQDCGKSLRPSSAATRPCVKASRIGVAAMTSRCQRALPALLQRLEMRFHLRAEANMELVQPLAQHPFEPARHGLLVAEVDDMQAAARLELGEHGDPPPPANRP